MVCKFCGNTIEDASEFCFICGNKVVKEEAPEFFAPVAPEVPVAVAPTPVETQPIYAQQAPVYVQPTPVAPEAPVVPAPVAPVAPETAEAAPAEVPAEKGKKSKKAKKEKKAKKDKSECSKAMKFFTVLFAITFVLQFIPWIWYKKAKKAGYEEKATAIINSIMTGLCIFMAIVCGFFIKTSMF